MNLSSTKRVVVPSRNICIINDEALNKAYCDALDSEVNENDLVLEISSGSGLLSMMTAAAGANKIVACKSSPIITQAAKKIIKKNGYSNKVSFSEKDLTDLIVGKDIPRKADLVVLEIVSTEILGEGFQTSLRDVKKRLLKKSGKVIPEACEIIISLIENVGRLSENLFVKNVCGFDVSEFNSITQSKFTLINEKPIFLSEPTSAFTFDFYDLSKANNNSKIVSLRAKRDGVCAGIIQWTKIELCKGIEYETNPVKGDHLAKQSAWKVPIYRFDEPVRVKEGQVLKIEAKLVEDVVWFRYLK